MLVLSLLLPPLAALAGALAVAAPAAWRDCPDCPLLREVPAGAFSMGSEEGEPGRPEGPVHPERIGAAFALGVHEVTVKEFRGFVRATGYAVAPGCRTLAPPAGSAAAPTAAPRSWAFDAARSWQDPGLDLPQRDDHPVVCVGRIDALAYAAWLSARTGHRYRLPTEAEWEYAARAGTTTRFPWGDDAAPAGCAAANLYDRAGRRRHDMGWEIADCDDGDGELAAVGRHAPNAFGLHDMIGNVWEWTADCYRERYDDPPVADDVCTRWSVRGGSWMTRPSRNRPAFRGRDPNDARYAYFGFRVARDPGPTP